jgi:hypothetical protein
LDLPFIYGIEALLILSWIASLLHNSIDYPWSNIKSDLCILGFVWFGITMLELINPAGASLLGWLSDARYPLLWLLSIPLCLMLLIKTRM